MNEAAPQVYFSYKWGGEGERIVNAIDAALTEEGIPFVRDKKDLGYKGGIAEFMQEIGRGSCVVVVICDKYLKSPNTMYELVEMSKNPDVRERIFPVVLSDADIYDATHRLQYVKYWEDKKKALSEAMRSVDLANLQGITDDLNNYDSIRDHVSRMTSLLKDMNTLTPDMHREANFAQLVDGLRDRLGQMSGDGDDASVEGDSESEDEEGGDEEAGEPDPDLEQAAVALVNDLQGVMDDPTGVGLMVFLQADKHTIDLAQFTTGEDGSLHCHLASNEQLPPELHLSASAKRELVTTYDFAAPEQRGGEYTYVTGPADEGVVAFLCTNVLAALRDLHGVSLEDLGWRPLR